LDDLDCYSKRSVTFTRTGDANIASLTHPASQPARVVSPAQALHGIYHTKVTFRGGPTRYKPQEDDNSVDTICLRSADRCLSRLVGTDGSGHNKLLIFANGAWARNEEFDTACPAGGTSQVKISGAFPLPNPLQDPIVMLTGNGHKEQSGSPCTTSDYQETLNRTERGRFASGARIRVPNAPGHCPGRLDTPAWRVGNFEPIEGAIMIDRAMGPFSAARVGPGASDPQPPERGTPTETPERLTPAETPERLTPAEPPERLVPVEPPERQTPA
jgi:hypothetical protein